MEAIADYVRLSELAFLLVRDPVVAEVIAVDAVLAAQRKSLSPDAPPAFQRARRKLIKHATSYMYRRRAVELLPWVKPKPPGLELPDATMRVWDAVGSLRPRQQAAVIMARLEGANLAEVADALEFSTSAANTHLDRARAGLRRRLGDEADLRAVLTRELREVARAFTRTFRPDPAAVEPLLRAGRWRAWTIFIGGAAIAGAVAFTLLRG